MRQEFNDFLYANKTHEDIKKAIDNNAIFIIPIGATEQHGPHHQPLTFTWQKASFASSKVKGESHRCSVTPNRSTFTSSHGFCWKHQIAR